MAPVRQGQRFGHPANQDQDTHDLLILLQCAAEVVEQWNWNGGRSVRMRWTVAIRQFDVFLKIAGMPSNRRSGKISTASLRGYLPSANRPIALACATAYEYTETAKESASSRIRPSIHWHRC